MLPSFDAIEQVSVLSFRVGSLPFTWKAHGEALASIGKVRLAGASSVKGRQFQACPVRSAAHAK
jgi:hypothetical protein